jgi:hypothetical protein
MRSYHFILGVSAIASLSIAIGAGCSSSSNKGSTSNTDGGGTPEDGGETGDAMAPCATDAGSLTNWTPVGASDAGIALLECEKAACETQWAACAADQCCNDAYIQGFQCLTNVADGGATNTVPMSVEEQCFGAALALSSDTNVSNLEICLLSACGVKVPDGGADGATSDAATSTTDASGDSATTASDAATTATDASGDGAIEQ